LPRSVYLISSEELRWCPLDWAQTLLLLQVCGVTIL
jgi:hypothetical protein